MAPVYLKDTSRIHALRCVYFVVLLVEALLERTKAFTGRFAVRTIPAEAAVHVDGDIPVVEQDGRVTLGLGRHTITVDAATMPRICQDDHG